MRYFEFALFCLLFCFFLWPKPHFLGLTQLPGHIGSLRSTFQRHRLMAFLVVYSMAGTCPDHLCQLGGSAQVLDPCLLGSDLSSHWLNPDSDLVISQEQQRLSRQNLFPSGQENTMSGLSRDLTYQVTWNIKVNPGGLVSYLGNGPPSFTLTLKEEAE